MSADSIKPVTLIMPYYDNPQALDAHIMRWWRFSVLVRKRMRAIIVDDASPNSPAGKVLSGRPTPFPIRLFRIREDVRWNWLAARNIAFQAAEEGWCAVTDIDHQMPERTALALVTGDHDPAVIYRFSRRDLGGPVISPHPNSWFMTRDMFWRVGGYDEALSGHYGTDGEYRRRCAATAKIQIMSDELHRAEHVGDSSTRGYRRKEAIDANVRRLVAERGPGWRPRVLSFPFYEVSL